MPTTIPPLQPQPLRPALRISSIRFALKSSPPTLAGLGAASDGDWPLWPLAARDDAAPLLRLPSPFGTPSWDLAISSAGPAAVWSRPGSAVSPLWMRVAAQDPSQLSQQRMGVYAGPRLVRGGQASGVTAVTEADGDNRLALILNRDVPQRLLPAIGRGRLIAGQLVNHGSKRWLFALCQPPGARLPERGDLRGESLPAGVLYVAALDASLALTDAAQQPFGDQRIYEFDVDSAGPSLVLAATTPRGWRAARGSDAGSWTATEEALIEPALLSPTVLAAGDGVQLALLQSAADGTRRLMVGRL